MHEWTAIAKRPGYRDELVRVWFCDNCAAIGPRKVQTKKEVIARADRAGIGALFIGMSMVDADRSGLLKSGDLIAKE